MLERVWTVYLSGEIHTSWRQEIMAGCQGQDLAIEFTSPVTVHEDSDDCGTAILGEEKSGFWKDHKGALVNSMRTKTLIEEADIVVIRFGEKYRQWNAAFDAGYAAALNKPYIVLHDPALTHALKEVDAPANAVAETAQQVVKLLTYVIEGRLVRS